MRIHTRTKFESFNDNNQTVNTTRTQISYKQFIKNPRKTAKLDENAKTDRIKVRPLGAMLEPPANGSGTSGSPTPSEQQYSLRWNDFHSSILSSFRRLRDEEDFVDVTLACEGCSFTAHKVVLSACSPYFRRLLKANPCEHPIVILRDVRGEDMESLLR